MAVVVRLGVEPQAMAPVFVRVLGLAPLVLVQLRRGVVSQGVFALFFGLGFVALSLKRHE